MSPNVMPFADYRPIAWAEARDDDTNPTCVILHLTASEATSQHGFFSNPANKACSNAHVARSGHIEQYIRGDRLSAADAYGSSRAFSVETQGADANGYWTPEQCESIARILAWAHRTYGIPLRLMTSSATGQHGIGWHRLGCDGNFPPMPNILAGRLQRGGGEVWSSAFGKVCPGDNRIKQIPSILERALELANTPQEDDTMPTAQEIAAEVAKTLPAAVWGHQFQATTHDGARIAKETAGQRMLRVTKDVLQGNRRAGESLILNRAIAKEVGADIDVPALATAVAARLRTDLTTAITVAIEAQPDRDAAHIAEAVVDELAGRITEGN